MQDLSNSLPYLLEAAGTTLWLAIIAIVFSTLIGVLVGIAVVVAGKWITWLILALVYVVRGIPILVQLFLVYFGLPFFGIIVDPYTVAIVAISLHMGALCTEIFRGALLSIPIAQSEGGLALGLTPWQLIWMVLLPQALRAALPPYVSMIPVTIKATALASVINIWELTLASKEIASQTLETFEVFGIAFALYFALCYPFTVIGKRLETRYTTYHL
ncbi:MAG: amino acid ABC transporter permease [Acidiferrobacterales bacterium]